MFIPMPIIHNACMVCFLLPTLLTGAAFTLPADLTPESWGKVFSAKRPTWVGLIRALMPRLNAMVEQGFGTLDSVRAIWAPDAARLARQKYGITSYSMFGMSEGMNMYVKADDPIEVLDNGVGRPLSAFDEIRLVEPGTEREVAAGEIGELTCRGPYTLSGYYNAEERNREAFSSEGFYRTGDLMVRTVIDGVSYYAFAGRTKDIVNRGFEKINCEEVEGIVVAHPSVSDCALVGMPDPVLGERGCIYIVPKAGRQAPTVVELAAFMQQAGAAKFKWPERVETIDALPLTKVGKLDKGAMRQLIAEKLNGEGVTNGK
jgi:non-ribosomal peptide synthetase component E (peptide arylation enzyme)